MVKDKQFTTSAEYHKHFLIPRTVPVQILARGLLIELSPSDWSGGGKDQSRISKIKAWSVLQLSSSAGREGSRTKDRQLADKSADRSDPVTRVCKANNNVVNQSTTSISSILSTNYKLLEDVWTIFQDPCDYIERIRISTTAVQ